jgi:1-acyl-sn-glycerol-3-phosphate acyltransferase
MYKIAPFILQTIVWIPTRLILKVFFHLHIDGYENVRGLKKGVIFAMNHVSEIDPFILPSCLNPFSPLMPMYFVTREKAWYGDLGIRSTIYGGRFFKLVGGYPALVGVRDYEKSLATHIKFLKDGKSVCIFPEGRKSPDAGLQRAKGGLVEMAKQSGALIVPVAVSGHFNTSYKEFICGKRTAMISFGKPITVEELFEGYEHAVYHNYETIVKEKVIRKIASLMDGQNKERYMREIRV